MMGGSSRRRYAVLPVDYHIVVDMSIVVVATVEKTFDKSMGQ